MSRRLRGSSTTVDRRPDRQRLTTVRRGGSSHQLATALACRSGPWLPIGSDCKALS
jgi:hypothetical protein